jgi:anti-sigma regulatory factor (Ser/Thr protein kinase)
MLGGILDYLHPEVVMLPARLNMDDLFKFVGYVVDEQANVRSSAIVFDFSDLSFIEPVGIVVLCNLIEYLKKANVKVTFRNHKQDRGCLRYLDDCQFFHRYLQHHIFPDATERTGTVPLQLIAHDEAFSYLSFRLIPWVGSVVGVTKEALDSMRACMEEIFHNVKDHSGVGIGCAFAQHYPDRSEIQIAISDFGFGIPSRVRSLLPNLNDQEALRRAAAEGFTTKSNVQNRGAGLPNLIRFVTRVGGNVLIVSGRGELVASPRPGSYKLTARKSSDVYPGTLVRVILKTHALKAIAADTAEEDFTW